jgi:tetratricopeptide (TPR) repeat protein
MLSPNSLIPQDVDRLRWSIDHSYVDEESLDILSSITKSYWKISKNVSIDMLSGISGHFATIAQLLRESHPTPIYNKLCDLISENALLLGKTFHEIREYDLAWEYYKFSLKVAQDTGNFDLWANGVGRIALLFIYWGEPQNALPFLQQAQKGEVQSQLLKPWLRAIEAEIHAMRSDVNAMQRALELSKLPGDIADDPNVYSTGYGLSRVAGYEGSCFVRLHQPERALPVLQQALTLCEPTSLRRHSILIADIGTVYAQLGDVNSSCKLINKSLEITDQTKSLVVLQRVYKARRALEPWKDSSEVKSLDEHIAKTFASLTKTKEQI